MSRDVESTKVDSVVGTEIKTPTKHVSPDRATTPTEDTTDPLKTPPRTPPTDPLRAPPKDSLKTPPKDPLSTPSKDPLSNTPKSPERETFPEESYHTPVKGSKKRPRDSSSPLDSTPKHRKTDIGPSSWFRSPESVQDESEDPPAPEFVSPTRRRRFLVPRPDPRAFDQVTSEMLGIEAPKHLLDLIPKSLILNKNCVEAAFDWLLDHWETPEETLGLDGVRLEQLYSTDQEELRKSTSFTEFEIDRDGELTITKIVELEN